MVEAAVAGRPADATDLWITVRAGAHPLIAYTSSDDQLRCGVVMPRGGLAELVDPEGIDGACRAIQAEREPEIVRAQRLQRQAARGQGDARAGNSRYALARHGARLLGRYRWAPRAWLARQHDLRFGSATVELTADARGSVAGKAP